MLKQMPKKKTKRDPKYLAYIRTLPCCVCGVRMGIVAHHESILGKGVGLKCSDYETLPLCRDCHHDRHFKGFGWFDELFIDYKREIIKLLIEYFGR